MTPEPEIISSKEILNKYNESNIVDILPSFKKINRQHRNLPRRTEVYYNEKTRRKMLVRVFSKQDDGTEEMCITWLRHNDKIYVADRD
jgi:hypothetical protein